MFIGILIVLAIFSKIEAAIGPSIEGPAFSKEWLNLLHYKKQNFGLGQKYVSLADGETFFLSPKGKKNPGLELQATISAFESNKLIGPRKIPIHCVFPARYNYLRKKGLIKVASGPCKKFHWWKKQLGAESLSLVFSSYYPSNPASFFGHTFLKVSGKTPQITDYVINFSAQTPDDHGIVFALKGLFGGHVGLYGMYPYYQKINEYTRGEDRDLWEYKLNLTPQQVSRMLDHLWELMQTTYFDYYFFDENCAYQLLTLLEVANPEWELDSGFYLYAIPIDTVKRVLSVPGAVTDIAYRPSFSKKTKTSLSLLEGDDREIVPRLAESGGPLPPTLSAQALDSLIHILRFQRFDKGKLSTVKNKLLSEALVMRSQKEVVEDLPPSEHSGRPDLSHPSAHFGLSGGLQDNQGLVELELTPALHSIESVAKGLPPGSAVDVLSTKIRYNTSVNSWRLEEFTPVKIYSLHPKSSFQSSLSWMLGVSVEGSQSRTCRGCVFPMAQVGVGTSTYWGRFLVFSLAYLSERVSDHFEKKHDFELGMQYGFLLNLDKWTVSMINILAYSNGLGDRLVFPSKIHVTRQLGNYEASLGAHYWSSYSFTGESLTKLSTSVRYYF